MWLTRVSILRPVAISMLVLALVILGLQSMSLMPKEFYPRIEFPMVVVTTVYPGAGPQEIETLVTKPIEDSVSGVNNAKNVTSVSQEGFSVVMVEFFVGTDIDTAASDVREKVDATRGTLPTDIEPPVLIKADIQAVPVVTLGLSSNRPPAELRNLADEYIKDRLGKVPGVASVGVAGGDVREILVKVDKGRLDAYHLPITTLTQVLQAENLNIPSGSVEEGRRDYSIRAVGEFATVDDVREVRLPIAGGAIRLGDIATVEDSVAERKGWTRLDRKDSVTISVQKASEANTVAVVDGIKRELELMTGKRYLDGNSRLPAKGSLPSDIGITVAFDQSKFIKDSLADVKSSLFLGALLAVLVVFLFLHTLRGTFIVALAIPTSLMATFTPIYFAGFTVNMMTMLAMSLSVGILVDDSIVVLENIYRHLRKGESAREAAYNGRSEIGLAAITITMVDVVVFVPIAFMGGIVGQFFRQFGITIATATLFSLFVSFTLTPMLASRWLSKEQAPELEDEEEFAGSPVLSNGAGNGPGPVARAFATFDRFYNALDRKYRIALAWALQHRAAVLSIGPVVLLGALLFGLPGGRPQDLPPALIVSALMVLGITLGLIFSRGSGRTAVLVAGLSFLVLGNVAKLKPLGFEFFPQVDEGQVSIDVEMPAGTSVHATDAVVRQIEDYVSDGKRFPEVESIFSSVGGSGSISMHGGLSGGTNTGTISLVLVDKTKRQRSAQALVAVIDRWVSTLPAANIKTRATGGGVGGGNEAALQLELTASDMGELNRVAALIADRMRKVPGTVDVDTSWKVGKPELQARIDRLRAADYGLTTGAIASALRTSLEGSTESKFREGGKEYDIRVRLEEPERKSLGDVGKIIVGTTPNGPVYLDQVATLSLESGPTKIDRKNRQRMVTVEADLMPGFKSGNVRNAIDRAIADVPMGDVTAHWGGEIEMMQESGGYMGSALLLSVALVFMLMAALFESLLSPFIIMFSLPMALIGAILGLQLAGETLSIISMIGIIMLMGLVTKNAILLVDYTNTLRLRGKERTEAILEAGPTRLRPILMTTLAMIMGMMPTALALGRGSEFRAPMAIAVVGGLALSTLLTLLFIPVMYTVVDDFSKRWLHHGISERATEIESG